MMRGTVAKTPDDTGEQRRYARGINKRQTTTCFTFLSVAVFTSTAFAVPTERTLAQICRSTVDATMALAYKTGDRIEANEGIKFFHSTAVRGALVLILEKAKARQKKSPQTALNCVAIAQDVYREVVKSPKYYELMDSASDRYTD